MPSTPAAIASLIPYALRSWSGVYPHGAYGAGAPYAGGRSSATFSPQYVLHGRPFLNAGGFGRRFEMPVRMRTSDRPTNPFTMPESSAGTRGSPVVARRTLLPVRYIARPVPSARSTSRALPLAATHSRLAGTPSTRSPEAPSHRRTASTSARAGENLARNSAADR